MVFYYPFFIDYLHHIVYSGHADAGSDVPFAGPDDNNPTGGQSYRSTPGQAGSIHSNSASGYGPHEE
jgi:hypothetical protein